MRSICAGKLMVIALVCAFMGLAHAADSKKEEEQSEIRKMSQDTLQRLY